MPWIANVVSAVPNVQTGIMDVTVDFVNSGQPKVTKIFSGNNLKQSDIQSLISSTIANLQLRDVSLVSVQSIVGQSYSS